ncbi:MAG: hypothetical protein BKP49_01200 [Treponema sp. CETP13]|nr:MAG: hypothetical protein BKP49_01200 [Treponema sp. CETP13]
MMLGDRLLVKKALRICVLYFLLFCVLISPVLGAQISLHEKKQVIKTEHFDFIYSLESEYSAQTLANVAEAYYREITEKLSVPDMDLHIPVTITPESDSLNGYFTPFPYNRIVMYDTVASAGSLQVFSNTLCSVFYHELTHAVSLNIRSSFWSGMATVFGDILSPSLLINCTTNFTEGVTVSFESANGEGRLNNAFSTQIIKQAKIEGKFPSLYDVTGARDTYPSGKLPYIFGGAFSKYLQETYGIQKYADFWEECGRLHLYTIDSGILRRVYNKTGTELWNDFYESIVIPEDARIPEPANKLENFSERSFPQNLCSASTAECGSVLLWQDGATGSIWGAKKRTPFSNYTSYKLISSVLNEHISVSSDAKYFTVSGFTRENKPQNVTQIYRLSGFADTLQATYTGIKIPQLRDAAIFRYKESENSISTSNNDVIYVTGVETNSQNSSLVLYKVHLETKEIKKIHSFNFNANQVPFTPADATNGKIIFLLKDGLDWKIALYDVIQHTCVTFDTGLDIQEMSVSGDTILLSCATKVSDNANSYPFYASVNLNDLITACDQKSVLGFCGDSVEDPLWTGNTKSAGQVKAQLYTASFSGAVYEPVLCGDDDIFYVSHFYDNWQLSQLSLKEEQARIEKVSQTVFTNTVFSPAAKQVYTASSEKYNPFSYMFNGVFIPFAGFNLSELTYMDYSSGISPRTGISWITEDPTEQSLLLAGIGYDFFTNSVMANFSALATNTYTTYGFDGLVETTGNSFAGSAAQVDFSYTKPLGLSYFYYILNNTAEWFYKNEVTRDTSLIDSNQTFTDFLQYIVDENQSVLGHYLSNYTQTGVLWEKNTGITPFQYLNFYAGIGSMEQSYSSQYDWNVATTTSIHLPQLLPIKNTKNITFNLPTTASFSYYLISAKNIDDWEKSDIIGDFSSTVVLFSTEIQKGNAIIPVYTRRFTIDGGYDQTFYTDFADNDICLHTKTYFTQTFNMGSACSTGFDLGMKLSYHPLYDNSKFSFNISFNLNN